MYLDERLEFLTAGVITGPFAERSFFLAVIRQKLPTSRSEFVRRHRRSRRPGGAPIRRFGSQPRRNHRHFGIGHAALCRFASRHGPRHPHAVAVQYTDEKRRLSRTVLRRQSITAPAHRSGHHNGEDKEKSKAGATHSTGLSPHNPCLKKRTERISRLRAKEVWLHQRGP